MNGPQRYNFEQIREQFNNELLNKNITEKIYNSTSGLIKIINSIVKTKGKNWAVHVINENGTQILNEQEQARFTEIFEPYIESILNFFGDDDIIEGGAYTPDISALSGLSDNFIKSKIANVTHIVSENNQKQMTGIDDIYSKIIKRIGNVNSTVNDYASKYGILRLEKEHDLEPDFRIIPESVALGISDGVFTASTAAGFPIPPNLTLDVLSKIKIPFRTIVFTIYLILDISRIAISVSGPAIGRKILSILLSLLELLRGDWKKSILSLIGYYGMTPLLIGELLKVFITMFRMLAPQLQQNIIYGSFDATKSLIIGILLSIFQITAPEQVRLPLIGALEKIAKKKAEMDGTLETIGISARPDYLSPSWQDLNNIQAVMSDEAYICSCEFEELIKAINKAPIIQFVLELSRIPINVDMRKYKCNDKPCENFVSSVIKQSILEESSKSENDGVSKNTKLKINGGRILHSRKNKIIS